MTNEEITNIILDPSPPWIPGTCYPIRRYELLHAPLREAIRALPNPFTPRHGGEGFARDDTEARA